VVFGVEFVKLIQLFSHRISYLGLHSQLASEYSLTPGYGRWTASASLYPSPLSFSGFILHGISPLPLPLSISLSLAVPTLVKVLTALSQGVNSNFHTQAYFSKHSCEGYNLAHRILTSLGTLYKSLKLNHQL